LKPIPFNKASFTKHELKFISELKKDGQLSGDGKFAKKCKNFFKNKFGFENIFLTTSCTDALEMIALSLDINQKTEIIVPTFAFVSCANTFETHGGKVIFADSETDYPNISYDSIIKNINTNTKALLIIHYGGIPCDIEKISNLCKKKNIILIEDCSHAIDSKHNNKYLGSYGDLSVFSFHETKNITCGEGGMLVVNNKKFIKKITQIYYKGTNRDEFDQKLVSKYQWVSYGASYLLSEINAAFLYGQLNYLDAIQKKRMKIFNYYLYRLEKLNVIPEIYYQKSGSAHIFYILCQSKKQRDDFIKKMELKKIHTTFHYLPLHKSIFYKRKYKISQNLPNADNFSKKLVRLPIFYSLKISEVKKICDEIIEYFSSL